MPRPRPFFARRLQALREAAGLSPEELAQRSGLNKQVLARLENGRQQPNWEAACLLARALDVSVAAFAPEPPDVPPSPAALEELAPRLWQAAHAYARAYDQLERKSRGTDGGSAELFARFQEAQVELNLAALDLFAGQAEPFAKGKPTRKRRRKAK